MSAPTTVAIAAGAIAPVVLLKSYLYLSSGKYVVPRDGRYKSKVVVITGGNAGIGYQCAAEMAHAGATVIMLCRRKRAGEVAAATIARDSGNKKVFSLQCDLSDFESVKAVAREIRGRTTRLDILINSAGINNARGAQERSKQGINLVMATNYYGHFLLTHLLLDLLKATPASRIVNVTSMVHKWAKWTIDEVNDEPHVDHGNKSYQRSKLAQVLFTRRLADELVGSGVTVNAVHPGLVRSHIFDSMTPLQKVLVKPTVAAFGKSVRQGAAAVLYCACAPELVDVSGQYFADCKQRNPSELADDEAVLDALWKKSCAITGV